MEEFEFAEMLLDTFENVEDAIAAINVMEKLQKIMMNHEEVLMGPKDFEIMFQLLAHDGREKVATMQTEFFNMLFQ